MVAPDSLPEVFRASDEDRDEVIRMLREGSAEGRLSQETFLARVDRALRARNAGELADLHRDLPPRARRGSLLARVSGWGSSVAGAMRAALPAPGLPPLA